MEGELLRDRLEGALLSWSSFKPITRRPTYLKGYNWYPEIVLHHPDSGDTVAFLVLRTKVVPTRLLEEAQKAQTKHRKFAVVLLAHLEVAGDELYARCKAQGFGLYVYTEPGPAITRVLPGRFEHPAPTIAGRPGKEGWVPQEIAVHAQQLKAARYRDVIKTTVPVLADPGTSLNKAVVAVQEAVEEIIKRQPRYLAEAFPLYRLAISESAVRLTNPAASEHVIHSFRVYVTGCVILEHFVGAFTEAWNKHLGLSKKPLEDVWFLTSLFHDCGRFRDPERTRMVAEVLEWPGEDPEVRPDLGARLSLKQFQEASRYLSSLLVHVGGRAGSKWVFGPLRGGVEDDLQQVLLALYERPDMHGVMSALDLAAQMIQRVYAASDDNTVNRAFLASCVFPAAAAITLHDWRAWEALARFGLFPFRATRFPLAALLIYIDTWDDYRRDPSSPSPISVPTLVIGKTTCTVRIEWKDPDRGAQEQVKYNSFKDNMVWSSNMRLAIELVNGENER